MIAKALPQIQCAAAAAPEAGAAAASYDGKEALKSPVMAAGLPLDNIARWAGSGADKAPAVQKTHATAANY